VHLPFGELAVIPGVAHLPQLEADPAYLSIVAGFPGRAG
jgi:pimeloyl-ACP methyl ester carboxylesterase